MVNKVRCIVGGKFQESKMKWSTENSAYFKTITEKSVHRYNILLECDRGANNNKYFYSSSDLLKHFLKNTNRDKYVRYRVKLPLK